MKSRNDDRWFSLIQRRAAVWGVSALLLMGSASLVSAQQSAAPRPPELTASAEPNFFSSMKDVRQRAAARYSQNMAQMRTMINQQIQQGQSQAQKQAQAQIQAQAQALTHNHPLPGSPQAARTPQHNHPQGQPAGSPGFFDSLQQFFGLSEKPGSNPSGFPQQAQQQSRSGFASSPQPQTMGHPQPAPLFAGQPSAGPQGSGNPHAAAPNAQQQAWLMQQRMQAATQQAHAAAPPPASAAKPERNASRGSAFSVDQLTKATTDHESALEVNQQIPWNALSPEARQRTEKIISAYTFYRRLPMTGGYCNPEIYDFLVSHPEVVVGTWETGGFKQLSLTNNGGGRWTIRDTSGTHGEIEVVYHDNRMIVFLCEGTYEGQLSPRPIQGDILCVMQYRFTEDTSNQNKPIVVTRLDTFVRMSSASADLVGKAFAPMIGKIADSNFVKTVDSVNQISELMERNPRVIAEMVQESSSIPDETKSAFIGYIERVTGAASMRSQGIAVDYYMMPKMNVAKSEPAEILSRRNQPGTSGTPAVVAMPQAETAAPLAASPVTPAPSTTKLSASASKPASEKKAPEVASHSAMPTPGKTVKLETASLKSSAASGASMPFPSASARKTVAKSEKKAAPEPAPVLSEGESLEEFNLNDDSNELVFSDDFSSSSDSSPSLGMAQETSDDGELSFDIDDTPASEPAPTNEVTVAKPVPETPAPKEEKPAAEDDGWSPVIASTAAVQAPADPQPGDPFSSDGQKCSWKKPEIR